MKTILAIDPGLSGGLAVRQFGKTDCHAMPGTLGDVFELIASFQAAAAIEGHALVCVLEEVSGFAGKAQPGSAMFKFGEHYGFVQGVIRSLGIRLELVRPQVWQKAFGLGTASRCASKTVWKNKLKAEAQRRYPQLKVTLKTADALLILDYALQSRGAAAGREAAKVNGRDIEHSTFNVEHRSNGGGGHRRAADDSTRAACAPRGGNCQQAAGSTLGINTEAWVGEVQSGELNAESGKDGGPKPEDEDDFPAAAETAAGSRNT